MPNILVDTDSTSLARQVALVQAKRTDRGRFAEGCVTIVADEEQARAAADPARHLRAAIVYGPSSSSEGQRLYYLVRWLV
ncbi:hypothetical protein CKO25_13800 [Thiocapsa imhoffii]|uniref:Uncharacterized protein n=2 Tax=Thiocapsa imhoffii TaxID=382777 RepID=A0A9X0WJJ0_9GAMM|nr:hypothetical protein [Thiocapsa imhoffii]